jgi:hypothetical protein
VVIDFEKARNYHNTAGELASAAHGSEPEFSDKEKINREIYAERTNDKTEQERCLALARSESSSTEREASVSKNR